MSMDNLFVKIKDFFLKNEQKIFIFIAFCLISAISFEFGLLQGQKWQQKPLIIEKPATIPATQENANLGNFEPSGAEKTAATKNAANLATLPTDRQAGQAGCPYVGSKSSTKFYLSTCSWAKSIKPENVVCFKTPEEAIGQGRTESKCTK